MNNPPPTSPHPPKLFSRRLCLWSFNSGIVEGRVSRWREIRALCFPGFFRGISKCVHTEHERGARETSQVIRQKVSRQGCDVMS